MQKFPNQKEHKKNAIEKLLLEVAEQMEKDCLRNLNILHSFHLLHKDIKPENIGYNRKKNQFVFLDFGFMNIHKEEAGELSSTHYIGTPSYSSEEMNKLFLLSSKGYADLYYNDLVGLKKSKK